MTQPTAIIKPSDYTNQLNKLIANISYQITRLGVLQNSITLYTSCSTPGVLGWLKQLQNILNFIKQIEIMILMIENIIVQIALLPAEAVTLAIGDIIKDINIEIQNLRAFIGKEIHSVLDSIVPGTSGFSQIKQAEAQLNQCTATLAQIVQLGNRITNP